MNPDLQKQLTAHNASVQLLLHATNLANELAKENAELRARIADLEKKS